MTEASALDRIDRRILAALQADGRLSNQALADRVALSPSACLVRVRRLEEQGVIRGYHARVDPFALSIGLVIFAEITLKDHRPQELAAFERAIQDIPAIVEATHVTGAYDYLLKVAVPDMDAWTQLAEDLTSADLAVERVITHVTMSKPKVFTGYPVSI